MNIQYAKNPRWSDSAHTMIDLIIKIVGLDEEIPFTAISNDIEDHGRKLFQSAVGGEFGPIAEYQAPVLSDDQLKHLLSLSVQSHLDSIAQLYGYDDIKTAISYADEPSVPQYQKEGMAFREWRSITWAKFYEIMSNVSSGEISAPEPTELIASLPQLSMPEK